MEGRTSEKGLRIVESKQKNFLTKQILLGWWCLGIFLEFLKGIKRLGIAMNAISRDCVCGESRSSATATVPRGIMNNNNRVRLVEMRINLENFKNFYCCSCVV